MKSVLIVRGLDACFASREVGSSTIMAGQRGAPGRPGTDTGGGIQTIVRTAGATISALRIVFETQLRVFPTDPQTLAVFQSLGLAITSATSGAEVTIQTQGFVDDASWSWFEGSVWCGPNGVLTQTPPISGWDFIIGFATSATRLYIDLNEPVLLA